MSSGKNGNKDDLFILHSRATVRTATRGEEETSDESSSGLSDRFLPCFSRGPPFVVHFKMPPQSITEPELAISASRLPDVSFWRDFLPRIE